MGNNQQRSGQPIRETRRRRSFNPNSSRKMKASSVSPNSYQVDNRIQKQRINDTSGLNDLNCSQAQQNQRIDNIAKRRDLLQSSKDRFGSKLNQNNSLIRQRKINEQNKDSNEMVLNKYLLRNEKCLSHKNPQQLLILSKYYDGSIIDQQTIKDISISHLNNTIRNDLSINSSSRDKNKRQKSFSDTSMSERLGIVRRHSYNTLAAAVQNQSELSIQHRQWHENNNWTRQEELMNISEFMAEYCLFAGFYAGKQPTITQTSFITLNMDLLEPVQEPPQGNGEIRQTFGPKQRDLELQRYLQFIADLESNSIEQIDNKQLINNKKRFEMQFSTNRLKGNNKQGLDALNKNQSMQSLQNKRQEEQTKQEQVQNYFLNQEISQQKDVSEILQTEFQRFEQSNQYVLANQNALSMREIPLKEQAKSIIGRNQLEGQGLESEKLSHLQKQFLDKSSQKINEDKYSLEQDTHEQAVVTQVEKDHLYQELLGGDQLFENKSVEETIEESKEMSSKEQEQECTHSNQRNAQVNQQGFSNMSSLTMNDNSKQEIQKTDNQIQHTPKQLAQSVRGQPLPSGRTFSEKSLGTTQQKKTVNVREIESSLEKSVIQKQDYEDNGEREILNQNSKLFEMKSAEFPQFSQSQSESHLSLNVAPLQNHFLPNFQYQSIHKHQPSLDPFQKTQVNQSSLNGLYDIPFKYLNQLEQTNQNTAKSTQRIRADRIIIETQVDDEIARKQMEIGLLDKRIGIVKDANEEAIRQRQERAQEKHNKSQNSFVQNQSCIINKADKTLVSLMSVRNQISQNLERNASNNNSSKYKDVYMNAHLYSNQHKKKRELQVDSYSQMLFPSQVPSEQSIFSRTQQEQMINQDYQDAQCQSEIEGVIQLNRSIQKEDKEQKTKNLQSYYNQKKEILKSIKNQQYPPIKNPWLNHPQNQERRQIPLFKISYQEQVEQKNKDNEFNHLDDEKSNENEEVEEILEDSNIYQQSQPIEVKMNLQDFRRRSLKQQQEEVIPIEIDIKQFTKKRSRDIAKTPKTNQDGMVLDYQRKFEIEEIGLKNLIIDRNNNSESEGETMLKSISRQVISLKDRIEKDQNILDQNRNSQQNKISTKKLTNQLIDSPTQFEQIPAGFETILEDEDSQFSTIPSNFYSYFNINNVPVGQSQLSKDQKNFLKSPTEEDDNKRYPVGSKFKVASETDHQLEHFNQVFQVKPNPSITHEENDEKNRANDNQSRQINCCGDGFDFSAIDSVDQNYQNQDHFTGNDLDSEDDSEPAKIKIDLNLFKKKL